MTSQIQDVCQNLEIRILHIWLHQWKGKKALYRSYSDKKFIWPIMKELRPKNRLIEKLQILHSAPSKFFLLDFGIKQIWLHRWIARGALYQSCSHQKFICPKSNTPRPKIVNFRIKQFWLHRWIARGALYQRCSHRKILCPKTDTLRPKICQIMHIIQILHIIIIVFTKLSCILNYPSFLDIHRICI